MPAEIWTRDRIRVDCAQCDGEGSVEELGWPRAIAVSPPYQGAECPACEGLGWVYTESCDMCTGNGISDAPAAGVSHGRALCVDCIVEARLTWGGDPQEVVLREWEPDLAERIETLQGLPQRPGPRKAAAARSPESAPRTVGRLSAEARRGG